MIVESVDPLFGEGSLCDVQFSAQYLLDDNQQQPLLQKIQFSATEFIVVATCTTVKESAVICTVCSAEEELA